VKVLLVASAGGHLQQLVWLRPWWSRHERLWVTFDTPEAHGMLQGERMLTVPHPTNRDPVRAARNLLLARRLLRQERPELVVSTGAAVAVPFFWAARALGVPTVFIEPYDRLEQPSLTGRLVAPIASMVVLQRREQLAFYRGGVLLGPVR
jgi:beta-1,4-N-acetylglucosaminyltransferase